jgi:hypothetical protein
MGIGDRKWSEAETIFAATAHFEESKPFSHIASVLGRSRCSVAGKIHRINREADKFSAKAAAEETQS